MFDRAACAAWRVGAAPYVDLAVLTALATLLQDVTSVLLAGVQPAQQRGSEIGSSNGRFQPRLAAIRPVRQL
jgi:hypothetical protein